MSLFCSKRNLPMFTVSYLFGNCCSACSEISTFRGRWWKLSICVCVNLCVHSASKIKANSIFVTRILMLATGVSSNCTRENLFYLILKYSHFLALWGFLAHLLLGWYLFWSPEVYISSKNHLTLFSGIMNVLIICINAECNSKPAMFLASAV